jgi:hypothetical protein
MATHTHHTHRQTHSTATKQKRTRANQQKARTLAQVARLQAKGLPAQTLLQVKKQGLRKASKIARNNSKPKPTTNRYTPAMPSKRNPKGTALGIARLCHTFSLKNGVGQYIQQISYPIATCTAYNLATGVYTFVVKQRNNNPATLVNLHLTATTPANTATAYHTGYSFIAWVKLPT